MCAQNLTAGRINLVAQAWGQRLRDAIPKFHPDDLYCGRAFLQGRKAANCLDAELFVISAGYGLVSERDKLAPYSLTVLPGKADSIARKVPRSEWSPNSWWRMLGGNTPAETDLCAMLAQRQFDLILMSLSAGYAHLIADELRRLAPDQKPRLRIFCAGGNPHLPPVVADNMMPYDARLDGPDSPIKGTMSDFSGRALHHYARCVMDSVVKGMNLAEDKTDLMTMMAEWTPPDRPSRERQTDEEIIAFILNAWSGTGGSLSTSLRLLRDSGRACKQERFHDLFCRAAIQRDAHWKDVT